MYPPGSNLTNPLFGIKNHFPVFTGESYEYYSLLSVISIYIVNTEKKERFSFAYIYRSYNLLKKLLKANLKIISLLLYIAKVKSFAPGHCSRPSAPP